MKKKSIFTPAVVALVMLSFFLGTSEFIVVGILPEISEGFDISLTKAGNIVSVFAFTYALGTPFLAAWAGKFNRFRFMLGSIGILALANLLCAVAPGYVVFLVARIITAVLSGTIISISMTFAEDIVAPQDMPKAIAWIFSGFSIASVFGVPISTMITQHFGWRAAFWFIFAATVVLILFLKKVLPRESTIHAEKLFAQFMILKNKKILLGIGVVFLNAAAIYTFYTYLTPIFETELGIPERFISMALLVFGVAALISNLSSGVVAERHGLKWEPLIAILLIIGMVSMVFTNGFLVAGGINIFLVGVLMYLVNVPVQTHFLTTAREEYPSCMNLASSFQSVFFNFGIAFGSACGGIMVNHVGMKYTSIGGAVLEAGTLVCCLALLPMLIKKNETPQLS